MAEGEAIMKEYRIVCERRLVHADGSESHYESVPVWKNGHSLPSHIVYTIKAEANKALAESIRHARRFDAETQERFASGDNNSIAYYQTNIRIQSRNVTEWKD